MEQICGMGPEPTYVGEKEQENERERDGGGEEV